MRNIKLINDMKWKINNENYDGDVNKMMNIELNIWNWKMDELWNL